MSNANDNSPLADSEKEFDQFKKEVKNQNQNFLNYLLK